MEGGPPSTMMTGQSQKLRPTRGWISSWDVIVRKLFPAFPERKSPGSLSLSFRLFPLSPLFLWQVWANAPVFCLCRSHRR